MTNKTNKLYEFEEYLLNAREKNLWRGNDHIPLPPKVFDTLLILVENAGRVVSKDEILESVWAETFVEESNLSQNIYSIRQVLGKGRKFIETVPRKGYKFIAPVTIAEARVQSISNDLEIASEAENVDLPPKTDVFSPEDSKQNDLVSKNRLLLIKKASFFALFGMSVLAILLFTGYVFKRTGSSQDLLTGQVTLRGLTDSGTAVSPTISPDGRFVAYIDRRSEKGGVRLMDIEARKDVAVDIGGGHVPGVVRFSQDGRDLYFRVRGLWRSGRTVYRVSYFGGDPTPVAQNVWGNFSLSRDGSKMVFFRSDAVKNVDLLVVKDLVSGEERTVAEVFSPDRAFMLVSPEFSPDGRSISFLNGPGSDYRSDIQIVDLETGSVAAIKTELQKIFHLTWGPKGDLIYALSKEPEKGRQLWQVQVPSGAAKKVTNDLNMYNGISITADGKYLVTEMMDTSANVWLYRNADPTSGKPLTSGKYGHYAMVDLEYATEDRIIYDKREEVEKDLWITSISSGANTRLTQNNGPRNTQAVSSSDGRYVYLSSNRDGNARIWRIGHDGLNPEAVTGQNLENHWYPALSYDGQHLYFIAGSNEHNEIRRVDLSNNKVETIFRATDFAPMHFLEASQDGRFLAFVMRETNSEVPDPEERASVPIKIGLLDLTDPTKIKPFTILSSAPMGRFTSGGRSFDYLKGNSIVRQYLDVDKEPETIFSVPDERIFNFDWSMAGSDLVVSRGGAVTDVVLVSLPDQP